MPPENSQPLPAGYVVEGYRIERPLSRGGFSMVYLAYDADNEPVALKEYLPLHLAQRGPNQTVEAITAEQAGSFSHGLTCFYEEGRVLTQIDHPNVVKVKNFFRANGTVYLVMRYERGRTLQEHIRNHRGAMREAALRKIFTGLLDGLAEVHSSGILHLDLKPGNIYLRADDSPVLLDFGAARFAVDLGPPAPRAMYTPGYAAPEQYHGKFTLGPWTDIYAVGACLYATLAGGPPPAADARMVDDQLQPARQLWADSYSPQLLATIDKCLRVAPNLRPQNAAELRAELMASDGDDGWMIRLRRKLAQMK